MKKLAIIFTVLFLVRTVAVSAQTEWYEDYVIVGIPNGFSTFQDAVDEVENMLEISITSEDEMTLLCYWVYGDDEIETVQLHQFEY
jgi:hypothetical protein